MLVGGYKCVTCYNAQQGYLFYFFLNLCPKRNTNSSGEVNFSQENGGNLSDLYRFFIQCGPLPYRSLANIGPVVACGVSDIGQAVC